VTIARDIELVERFAKALDLEDYDTALSLLAQGCVYRIRGETIVGAEAVVASYRGNGEAARSFDSIAYGSDVRAEDDGLIVIEFWDELPHRGRVHRHRCEQWVRTGDGVIVEIEHRDLDGELESLAEFKRCCNGNGV
jgi:limonene-1,2-epoxide hydrolase